jgi:putative RNA 2'-phosphotransferase
MKWQQQQKRLEQMLAYMLERRPDEFGLVLDADGYVGMKALVKALSEEAGWKKIRRQQIEQLVAVQSRATLELEAHRIRSRKRGMLLQPIAKDDLPGLLYTCVRQRAYSRTIEKGLQRIGETILTMSADKAMALRLGKRKDNHPVLLTVHTGLAQAQGTRFSEYGCLYLADQLAPGTFAGPPLPAEKTNERQKLSESEVKPKTPGSFTLKPPKSYTERSHRVKTDTDGGERPQHRKRRDKSKKWSREVPPWKR